MVTIKCYDQHGRLWKSKLLKKESFEFFTAIQEAEKIIGASCAWLKEKNTSTKLSFTSKKNTGSTYYIGSSGKIYWMIPLQPNEYPLTTIHIPANKIPKAP